MAKVNLTAQRLRERLNYDPETGLFTWLTNRRSDRIGIVAGGSHCEGYRDVWVDGTRYLQHRLAWLHFYGEWPKQSIDHINMNRADNRIVNLRDVSKSVNAQNQRDASAHNTQSGLLGVSRNHGKWKARLQLDGKQRFLGAFDTPEEAHAAYITAKRAMHPGCTM